MEENFDFVEQLINFPTILGHAVGKDKLTDLHDGWIHHCFAEFPEPGSGKIVKTLAAHRGSYKTTAITEIGIIWILLFHPNVRIGLFREVYTEAKKIVETVLNYFQNSEIGDIFEQIHGFRPVVERKLHNAVLFNFKKSITKEGSINWHGLLQGSFTGNHYDVVICDDVVTPNSRYSEPNREQINSNYLEVRTNILERDGLFVHTGTFWHPEDAWSIDPPQVVNTYLDTGILSLDDCLDIKKVLPPVYWACNYELKHITDVDRIFRNPMIEDFDMKYIFGKSAIAHVDAKYSGTHTGALTILRYVNLCGYKHEIYVFGKLYFDNFSTPDMVASICNTCHNLGADRLILETNADKGLLASVYDQYILDNDLDVSVRSYHESTNKTFKILSYIPHYWENIIFSKSTDPNYLEQILDYEEGKEPDDAADSLASVLRDEVSQGTSNILEGMHVYM